MVALEGCSGHERCAEVEHLECKDLGNRSSESR